MENKRIHRLVLRVRSEEAIIIDNQIRVEVKEVRGRKNPEIKLLFESYDRIPIMREKYLLKLANGEKRGKENKA